MPENPRAGFLATLSETREVEILRQVGSPQRRYEDLEAPSSSLRNPCATSAMGVFSGRDVGSHKRMSLKFNRAMLVAMDPRRG
jgi:hypothetical protein